MHIPDGFLPLWQAGIYYIITIVALYFALQWAKQNLDEKACTTYGSFSSVYICYTSHEHTYTLGNQRTHVGRGISSDSIWRCPWAAVLVLAVVLTIQGFFFGDGGITALGANILDMGVIAGFTGFGVFTLLKKVNLYVAIFLAGWASIFVAAIAVAIEMALAGTFPADLGLFFMGLYHGVIGIAEGAITVIAILAIQKVTVPDLLPWYKNKPDTEVDK